MTVSLWTLPGPARFVDSILESLQDGKNVVVGMPDSVTSSLYYGLLEQDEQGESVWQRLNVAQFEAAGRPVDLLIDYFQYDVSPGTMRSINMLFDIQKFLGIRLWIDQIPAPALPAWCQFLTDYQHICGTLNLFDRPLLCCQITGDMARSLPDTEVRLDVYHFDNVMTDLDILTYLLQQRNISDETHLERRIAYRVIAELAMWDIELARYLSRQSLENLLNPDEILHQFTLQREWDNFDGDFAWYSGAKSTYNGQQRVHTCLLSGKQGELERQRRIWRAQVSILLPFIEEERLALLQELEHELTVPFETFHGQIIKKKYDLEIGHLYSQFVNNPAISVTYTQRASLLRDMRNQLAHLQCITTSQLREYQQFQPLAWNKSNPA